MANKPKTPKKSAPKKVAKKKIVKKPVAKVQMNKIKEITKPQEDPLATILSALTKDGKVVAKHDAVPSADAAATVFEYKPEADNSGVPKNFRIKCNKCLWSRLSSGTKADLVDLHEINAGCKTCGKWRKFHCQKCGQPAFMKRIKGNT